MGEPMKVAVLGCGSISAAYFATLAGLSNVEVVSVTDLDRDLAEKAASEQGVPRRDLAEVLADPEVDAVLNITPPRAHAPLCIEALRAGKHVYVEKPFAAAGEEADALLRAGRESGCRIGSAPDTVLGTGLQTARQVIDSGTIGTPIAATATMLNEGFESWHPGAAFMYQPGGGPLLEMGVYYIASLVSLFGPITSVYGQGDRGRDVRIVPEGAPQAGRELPVDIDTFVSATLRHAGGVISTLLTSYDVVATTLPPIEAYGTAGTVLVPDPNAFDDPVRVSEGGEFRTVEPTAGFVGADRGVGLSDMARALRRGEPHRQSAEFGHHVNDVMTRILESCADGEARRITSTCDRPEPVPLGSRPDDD
ncbi:Gfo/Idh/MocA family protein [Brachybacterium sp. AOP43-C2-M15]|uniref:Gfo/Idh/MocA family protein n=1 Tax=Brachybacterium sp. AOP43-C2-M15 TaxID=3457661 RepID=UPI004034ABD3